MKDTAPYDALGYVLVSLPDRGDWQVALTMNFGFSRTLRAVLATQHGAREHGEAGNQHARTSCASASSAD